MASKRSRIVRSSSHGEMGLFTQIQPIEPPRWEQKRHQTQAKAPQNGAVSVVKQEQQSCRSIFRLGWPTTEPNGVVTKKKVPDEGFDFLKACSLCKKKLQEKKDVYMYGDLTAFCSPECRDYQMGLDGFHTKTTADHEARMTLLGKSNAAAKQ